MSEITDLAQRNNALTSEKLGGALKHIQAIGTYERSRQMAASQKYSQMSA